MKKKNKTDPIGSIISVANASGRDPQQVLQEAAEQIKSQAKAREKKKLTREVYQDQVDALEQLSTDKGTTFVFMLREALDKGIAVLKQ